LSRAGGKEEQKYLGRGWSQKKRITREKRRKEGPPPLDLGTGRRKERTLYTQRREKRLRGGVKSLKKGVIALKKIDPGRGKGGAIHNQRESRKGGESLDTRGLNAEER